MKKVLFILFALLPMMASAQYGKVTYYREINGRKFFPKEIKFIGDSIGFKNPDKKIISYETIMAEKIGEKGLHDLELRRDDDYIHLSRVNYDIDEYDRKSIYTNPSFHSGTMDETIQEAVKSWLANEGNNVPSDKKLAKRHIKKKERLSYWLNNIKTHDSYYREYVWDCMVWYKPFIEDSIKKAWDETIKGLYDKVQITKENKLYSEGYSIRDISEILVRSKRTVSRVLKDNGIEIRIPTGTRILRTPFPKEKETDVVEDYLTGYKNSYIQSKWGISQKVLYRILRDYKVELRMKRNSK